MTSGPAARRASKVSDLGSSFAFVMAMSFLYSVIHTDEILLCIGKTLHHELPANQNPRSMCQGASKVN